MGCCEGCNTKSKILAAVAGVLGLIGIILIIVAVSTGSNAVSVEFAVADSSDFQLTVAAGTTTHCGFSIYTRASANCNSVKNSLTITRPDSQNIATPIYTGCDGTTEQWAKDMSPVLNKVGHWWIPTSNNQPVSGNYRVQASSALWAVDACQQVGEAISGIMAAIGIFAAAITFLVIALIVACVSCCCMGSTTQVQQVIIAGGNNPNVVGQPVSVVPK
mmetsp:Transcript_27855/g.56346  ORF Transcript_27855/g.56346 Transcript_27855/m.56346 type:complete len:218 (-) Transcript_27855:353-1006(-)|eukprot:CAMPEP_0113819006 /NCGR_PEP_ID=MMETSP0328-20130328/524_1 /TAXON_ID=39455 /ORGANISM="Alexandrium minutum" /LENGTH=217 /DNA_ID=CAMNT_0000786941 /DNA_START=161 /DNA_END=814 /DNA_ORIENTATION=+ /assembly_acc=CAM_ASM_000350